MLVVKDVVELASMVLLLVLFVVFDAITLLWVVVVVVIVVVVVFVSPHALQPFGHNIWSISPNGGWLQCWILIPLHSVGSFPSAHRSITSVAGAGELDVEISGIMSVVAEVEVVVSATAVVVLVDNVVLKGIHMPQ